MILTNIHLNVLGMFYMVYRVNSKYKSNGYIALIFKHALKIAEIYHVKLPIYSGSENFTKSYAPFLVKVGSSVWMIQIS